VHRWMVWRKPDRVEQTKLRQAWLEATAEIRAELLSGATDEDALGLIALRTLELTGSDATFIVLGPDSTDGNFTVRAQRGPYEPNIVGRKLDGADPLLREVVDGRSAVLTGRDRAGDPYVDLRPAHHG
jgi:hypothetical protein